MTQPNKIILSTKCSFCITVRPRLGLKPRLEKALVKWIKKNITATRLDGAYMAIEKEGEARHAHIQLWYPKKIVRGNVCSPLVRMCATNVSDWDPGQKKVLRGGVKMAYSDWYLDYLEDQPNKEADFFEVVIDQPPLNTSDYYPTEDEQEALKKKANSCNAGYHQLELLYKAWAPEHEWDPPNKIFVARFLSAMILADKIRVIKDPRKARQECSAFYYWLKGNFPDGHWISKKELIEIAEANEIANDETKK